MPSTQRDSNPLHLEFLLQMRVLYRCATISNSLGSLLFSKAFLSAGARSIVINDQLCGVRNITNNNSILSSEICYSDPGKGISNKQYSLIKSHVLSMALANS